MPGYINWCKGVNVCCVSPTKPSIVLFFHFYTFIPFLDTNDLLDLGILMLQCQIYSGQTHLPVLGTREAESKSCLLVKNFVWKTNDV